MTHCQKLKWCAGGLVGKSCLTLVMLCSLPGSSVHGDFQARILEWVAISSPGDLPNPGIDLSSPTLQAGSLLTEPQGPYGPTYMKYILNISHIHVTNKTR